MFLLITRRVLLHQLFLMALNFLVWFGFTSTWFILVMICFCLYVTVLGCLCNEYMMCLDHQAKWSWLGCRRKASSQTGWVMQRGKNWMKVLSTQLKRAKYANFPRLKYSACFSFSNIVRGCYTVLSLLLVSSGHSGPTFPIKSYFF